MSKFHKVADWRVINAFMITVWDVGEVGLTRE